MRIVIDVMATAFVLALMLDRDVRASFKLAAPFVFALMAWRILWTPRD